VLETVNLAGELFKFTREESPFRFQDFRFRAHAHDSPIPEKSVSRISFGAQ
jgi:hypothetical protein